MLCPCVVSRPVNRHFTCDTGGTYAWNWSGRIRYTGDSSLKGESKRKKGLYQQEGNAKYTQQVFNLSTYGIMSSQSTFESRENTPLTAATLCVVASVFDVMNNAGMLGSSVCTVMSQPFLCFSLVKNKPTWLSREELKFEASKQNKQNKKLVT